MIRRSKRPVVISKVLKETENRTEPNTYILSHRWVPAQEGIIENERAHILTSQTTGKGGTDVIRPQWLVRERLKSALIRGGRGGMDPTV